jgi:hypothetical protein
MTNAMFNSLLQGVTQEVAGVMSGQQSNNTVAQFLRSLPDFTYTAGESFLFDLLMGVAEHVTFRDLMGLFFGQPEVLNNMQEHLRTFVRNRILLQGDFTEQSMRTGSMLLVNQAVPVMAATLVIISSLPVSFSRRTPRTHLAAPLSVHSSLSRLFGPLNDDPFVTAFPDIGKWFSLPVVCKSPAV